MSGAEQATSESVPRDVREPGVRVTVMLPAPASVSNAPKVTSAVFGFVTGLGVTDGALGWAAAFSNGYWMAMTARKATTTARITGLKLLLTE